MVWACNNDSKTGFRVIINEALDKISFSVVNSHINKYIKYQGYIICSDLTKWAKNKQGLKKVTVKAWQSTTTDEIQHLVIFMFKGLDNHLLQNKVCTKYYSHKNHIKFVIMLACPIIVGPIKWADAFPHVELILII